MAGSTTEEIRGWLLKVGSGDPAAKDALLRHTQDRLSRIARRMLHGGFARVESFEQTDDVVQEMYVRLLQGWDRFVAKEDGTPIPVADYFSRAAHLIRQVLIELARRHYGRRVARPRMAALEPADSAGGGFEPGNESLAPDAVALFTDFHRAVEQLPENLRQVVDLHWYQDLTHTEIALLLGIGESTVRKYWVAARLTLQEKFGNNPFNWSPLGE